MALIIRGKTRCGLCNEVIKDEDEIIATSHFIADDKDPLWPLSDAAMHKGCFLGWNQRGGFVAKYNEVVAGIRWGNGTYHHMKSDGSIVSLECENLRGR